MKLLIKSAGLLALCCAMFGAGYRYHHHTLLSTTLLTIQPLKLYASDGKNTFGTLPAGTTLYGFDGPDEYPHFMLIIGTKALAALRPSESEHYLQKDPISADIE